MKHEDRIGKAGQKYAATALRALGIECVEKVATPTILLPTKIPGTFRVIYEEPVSGDHRGILLGGRSVLAEVKTIMDRNLAWSDLRPHQPPALDRHAELGGLALLVWVHHSGIYIMQWPVIGFGPHKSIKPEQAEVWNITDLQEVTP
jgi:hypothetical protein